ncbi:Polyprotein [Phytophthora palmivora]|uniref:Polyprotein n=1 Tax=Phytophthora palmivora TaxID=4796 RepID=A0A2P4XN64_9STRA|nr:Polyprotein [Phytophthora palmivora]
MFLGLAGYYRRFSHQIPALVLRLSSLIKLNVEWTWHEPQRQAFNAIKLVLQQAPVLSLAKLRAAQIHEGADLPVAFYGKKLGVHELNWPVHEKELFAIKQALARWRHYLHGARFDGFTDNSACKWFLQHPRVSGRLGRWLDFFAAFDFKLHHRLGSQNIIADALSRPPMASSKPGDGEEGQVAMAAGDNVAICALRFSCATCSIVQLTYARAATHAKLITITPRDQKVMP